MCTAEGVTAGAGFLQIGGGIIGAASTFGARKRAKDTAKMNARIQRHSVLRNLQGEAEAVADERFALRRAALEARGRVQASGLGARSTKALARAVSFQEGTDAATINRNFEIAKEVARMQLLGIDANLNAAREQIGDTSGFSLALDIVGAAAGGAATLARALPEGGSSLEIPSSSGDVSPIGERLAEVGGFRRRSS